MPNVAIYCRVSTDIQSEKRTIEAQIEFAKKYCDLHELNIINYYLDNGISGTIPVDKREAGSKLLSDAKNNFFDTILIYKLDRLGRSARVILNAVHELEGYGTKMKSMTEPFDTGDAAGRFLLTILAGVADLERSNILDRMWHGANRAARNGKWLGGIVPYGYYVDEEHHLAVNDTPLPGLDMSESDVVRLLYALTVEQHMSTIKIADYLNALGVPPSYSISGRQIKKGKRKENTAGIWRPARIRNMIINKTYMGVHEYGKRSMKNREIITREVDSIISQEIWNKAQFILKDNQLEATRSAKRKYLLRGLIKCGICGLNYSGSVYNSGEGYYTCNGKISYRGPLQGKCKSKNIPQSWVEGLVWQDCMKYITDPSLALAEINSNMQETKDEKSSLEVEKALVSGALRDKEEEKQSILDLYRRKLITGKDVEVQLQKIADEKMTLEARMELLSGNMEAAATLTDRFYTAEQLLIDLRNKLTDDPSFETKREIIKTLVQKVVVDTKNPEDQKPQASISVYYSFDRVVLHTDRDSSRQSAST